MRNSAKISIYIITFALCAAVIALCALFLSAWGVVFKIIFYGLAAAGISSATVFLILKKEALLKTCFILVCCLAFFCATVVTLSEVGDLGALSSDSERIDKLTDMIERSGHWGMLVYVLVQVLQVLFIPLPAVVCYIPGTVIWGPLVATLLASSGVIIGSFAAYWLGRIFGKRIVVWIAGKEATEKYSGYIAKKGKVIFVIMQILPFFPDDILCLVAGMTCMSFPFFAAVIVLVRPCIVAAYCFLGGMIPFSGWGIPVWIAVVAVCIVLAVLSLKYQSRIEEKLMKIFKRDKKDGGRPSGKPEPVGETQAEEPSADGAGKTDVGGHKSG